MLILAPSTTKAAPPQNRLTAHSRDKRHRSIAGLATAEVAPIIIYKHPSPSSNLSRHMLSDINRAVTNKVIPHSVPIKAGDNCNNLAHSATRIASVCVHKQSKPKSITILKDKHKAARRLNSSIIEYMPQCTIV